jgi:holo-[acyl-carrier protein] synthase
MAIYGTGIDIVEIERIDHAVLRHGESFLAKLFTSAEREYCDAMPRPSIHYAARFAAKEAVAKAFGTGIGRDVGWLDMEIIRDASGRPSLRLTGPGKRFAAEKGITSVHISLSHAKDHAVASAVAETGGGEDDFSC